MAYTAPFWHSSSLDLVKLNYHLNNYIEIRSRFNDPSLPEFTALIKGILTNIAYLQTQINTGSATVNQHTHQTAPAAHQLFWDIPNNPYNAGDPP